MERKLIFLDVDGVLNPNTNIWYRKQKGEPTNSYHIKLPGDKLYRLRKIVKETNGDIIVTSSWRIGFNRNNLEPSPAIINLRSQLNNYGLYITGYTPLHKDRHRGREITDYLNMFYKMNGYNPKYIIIDDDIQDIIDSHIGHIVHTNTVLGLQDQHVHIAINLLNNQ